MLKLRLTLPLLKIASLFIDYEAEALPPDSRIIEYGFVASKLAKLPPSRVLDVGCTSRFNYIPTTLCFSGWQIDGIDTRNWLFHYHNFNLIIGDVRHMDIPDETYDYVYAISTIEHIGLPGYYGEKILDEDGDLKATKEIHRVLKNSARCLITVPYKREYRVKSGTRRYDEYRLERLIENFIVIEKIFYTQDNNYKWYQVEQNDIKDEEVLVMLEVQK